MFRDSYEKYQGKEIILRDQLAIDRTHLANENTLLAYIRTAMTFIVVGASLLKFLDDTWALILGWLFVPVGIATAIVGLHKFLQRKVALKSVREWS